MGEHRPRPGDDGARHLDQREALMGEWPVARLIQLAVARRRGQSSGLQSCRWTGTHSVVVGSSTVVVVVGSGSVVEVVGGAPAGSVADDATAAGCAAALAAWTVAAGPLLAAGRPGCRPVQLPPAASPPPARTVAAHPARPGGSPRTAAAPPARLRRPAAPRHAPATPDVPGATGSGSPPSPVAARHPHPPDVSAHPTRRSAAPGCGPAP